MGKTEGSNNRILRKFVPQSTEDCYSVLERSIKSEANWLKRHKARVFGRFPVPQAHVRSTASSPRPELGTKAEFD